MSYTDEMPTANLTLPNGTTVTIEGTADEVAILLSKCSGGSGTADDEQPSGRKTVRKRASSKGKKPKRKGPLILIEELVGEDYFKSKRTIGDVQKRLEEKGHIYAQNSLSPGLLKLTRDKRVLRRLKEKGAWVYVS